MPRSGSIRFVISAVLLGLVGPLALAQSPGLLITVPANLDSFTVERIKERVNVARSRGADQPTKIIFRFNPNDQDATSSNYGPCGDLADAIRNWTDVNTVAFVSRKLTGHAVLPALCCNELVMSKEAQIGEIVPFGAEPLQGLARAGYEELLGKTRPAQFAVVRKMFDKSIRLMKGSKGNADWFYNATDRAKLEKEGLKATDTKPISDEGIVGLFNSDAMRDFGFRKTTAQSVSELANLYSLTPGSLRDDPLGGRAPVAYRLILRDAITQASREPANRAIRDVVRAGGNLLFLQLECDEGDLAASRDFAEDLLKFQYPETGEGIRIVAFIPNNANNTAAILAFGCSEIAMSTRKAEGDGGTEGTFGNFEPYMNKFKVGADAISPMLSDLAGKQQYSQEVARGMVEKDLVLLRVRGSKDRRKQGVLTQAQFAADKDNWEVERELKPKGQLLKLTATEAKQLGFVGFTIEGGNIGDLYAKYGVDPAKVTEATPEWLNQFRSILQLPILTGLLILVGFIGLLLELKVPGTTVPGIVAALCFILVFWAWAPVSGQLALLAGLLFILGLILVLLEVFVLPGFGVAGIVGILLMLGSLVLVTVDKLPENGSDWLRFGGKLATYLFALIGAGIGSFTIARFLPKVPLANRMVLGPTADREALDPTILPGAAQAAALLGAIGVATTVLRPAGTVQFGEEFVDVVSDGSFLPVGTRVQVIEVEGTRIVVQEV